VEAGPVHDIFKNPQHPYTAGLLTSMPRLDETEAERLATIPGQPPNLQRLPPGCSFSDRCRYVFDRCGAERPLLTEFAPGRMKACHLPQL
jgi:oligopeptide transport system ATP-binding protein